MTHPLLPWIAAGLFAMAVLHTFSTKFFEHLAHTRPRHAGIWHLMGEVEVVFGFWAMVVAGSLHISRVPQAHWPIGSSKHAP